MIRALVVLVACLAAISTVEGQFERCHTLILTPHHFLDLPKFLGTWYPLKLAPSRVNQVRPLNFTCHSATITQTAVENVLDFEESWLEIENGSVVGPGGSVGQAVIGEVNPEEPLPAIWSNHDSTGEINGQSVIVASDEDSWFVEYTCTLRDGALLERIILFSRRRYLEPLVEKTLDTYMYGLGFPYDNFRSVEQSQC